MFIGMDHTPTGVISGAQCATHRISIDVDISVSDSALRHKIYYEHLPENVLKIYPHGGITLKTFLDQCQAKNVVPLVNLNFGRQLWDVNKRPDLWKAKYTLDTWRRLARLVAEIITQQYNFSEQYLQVFNEPLKWLDRYEVGMYTRMTNQGIGTIRDILPIVIGNEERALAATKGNAFEYWCIHFSQDFDYIGGHPLSSVKGNYSAIKYWHDLGKKYNKPVMATEAGSWYDNYTSPAGHDKNKRIILECKKYGYRLCNIVLIDCNSSYFPRLGYRGWDKYYTKITHLPEIRSGLTYFQDFINFIKEHGQTKEEELMEYLRPIVQQKFYEAMGWEERPYHENTPSLPIVGRKNENSNITWADFDAVIESILKGLIKGLKDNNALPNDFPEPMNIKYNEDGSWNVNWKDVAKSGGTK